MYKNQIKNRKEYVVEDEIDLKEIFLIIKKNFLKILFFVITINILTTLYLLSIPNLYSSSTTLLPQNKSSKANLGGLSVLAGFAGVNIGSENSLIAEISYINLLSDKEFMFDFIKKNSFDKKLLDENLDKSYIFAFSFRKIYDFKKELFNFNSNKKEIKSENEILFNVFKKLRTMLSIVIEKDTFLIKITATHASRKIAKEIVESFLNDATKYLIDRDMKDINQKIKYYKEELVQTNDISLKEELSKLISTLIQKRVLAKSSQFYSVKQIIKPQIAFIQEKVKPARGAILIVSFITSFILGIFLAFFAKFMQDS